MLDQAEVGGGMLVGMGNPRGNGNGNGGRPATDKGVLVKIEELSCDVGCKEKGGRAGMGGGKEAIEGGRLGSEGAKGARVGGGR